MNAEKINQFMILHGDKFSEEDLFAIKERLEQIDDGKFSLIVAQEYSKPNTLFWASFFVGWLGIDRLMLGQIGLGLAKLFFCWLTLFIWWLIDLFLIKKAARTVNFEKFTKASML